MDWFRLALGSFNFFYAFLLALHLNLIFLKFLTGFLCIIYNLPTGAGKVLELSDR